MLAPATLDPTLIHDAVAESLSLAEWEESEVPTKGGGMLGLLTWIEAEEQVMLTIERRALDVLAVRRAPIPWLWRRP